MDRCRAIAGLQRRVVRLVDRLARKELWRGEGILEAPVVTAVGERAILDRNS